MRVNIQISLAKGTIKMIMWYYINQLVNWYRGFVYQYRHHIQRKPIIWYAGRGKGTLVVTGKPDFSRPLKWTRCELIGGHFKYTENDVTDSRICLARVIATKK